MNRIVLQHYPVDKLPEDIQRAVGGQGSVTLTIDREDMNPVSKAELVRQLKAEKEGQPDTRETAQDAVTIVRKLRDEWDS